MKTSFLWEKSILAPLGITAATSGTDAVIQKKIRGSGTTTFIVQPLEDSNILLEGVTKTMKNETKGQKWGFLGVLLSTLGAILLGKMLARKRIVRAAYGNKIYF